jgi:hypothetical protein
MKDRINPDIEPDKNISLRKWAMVSIMGVVVYIILDVILQLLPPHYSPLRQAESDLAVGHYGFIMNINFLIRGILSFSVIMPIYHLAKESASTLKGIVFFEIWCVASFLLAFFNTDVYTYSHTVMHHTFHGEMHLILAFTAFLGAPAGEILLSLSFSKIGQLKTIRTPVLILALLSAFFLILLVLRLFHGAYFGLFERLFIGSVLLWIVAVSVKLIRLR